jgi:signal transduction histidine kinase
VSQNLASIFDIKEIYIFVGDSILSTLKLNNICIMSAVPGGGYEVVYRNGKSGESSIMDENGIEKIRVGRHSDIVTLLRSSDDIIIRNELSRAKGIIGEEAIDNLKNELASLQCEMTVPVFVDDELAFLICLGGKSSGDKFTGKDINLLNTISDLMASAVKNARMYKDKIHAERLASIGIMSATFAHEIRNPLTSMKTFAQLIQEKYNDAEFRDKFSKIVLYDIERINGLIEDLLDFSEEKKSPGINNFDVTVLLDETVNYVKNKFEIENKIINIEKQYDNYGFNLYGNSKKLKHAFVNIINNGCQAMNGGGVLKVAVNSNDTNVDIAITDSGEGISPEDIEKIFDPFVTTKKMGMGIGLAISKKIIEDHGGKIKVKSELSMGTTFTISLPAEQANMN